MRSIRVMDLGNPTGPLHPSVDAPAIRRASRSRTSHGARSIPRVLARFERNGHLDLLIELAEDRNHPVKREAAKLRVADAREFRVRNAGEFFRVRRRELAFVEHANELRGRNGARLLKAGIRPAKIAIDITAAANQLEIILAYFSASFNPKESAAGDESS